jgi:hypothetical protein
MTLGEWVQLSKVAGHSMMHQSDRVPRPTLDRFKRWF